MSGDLGSLLVALVTALCIGLVFAHMPRDEDEDE
jgi:hypothetical protein